VGVCDFFLFFCDDYDYGIRQVAGNDDYDDDYNNNEGRYIFFRLFAQGEEPPNTGFPLDATSGFLATASASAPAMFLALGSRRLGC